MALKPSAREKWKKKFSLNSRCDANKFGEEAYDLKAACVNFTLLTQVKSREVLFLVSCQAWKNI